MSSTNEINSNMDNVTASGLNEHGSDKNSTHGSDNNSPHAFDKNSTHDKIISLEDIPRIDKDLLAGCIHCGLCLPACPTYLATGRETESPRGRIYLMTQWQAGRQQLTDRMAEHIESCLGCLGCQTACPSGVQYEKILDQARPYLAARRSKFASSVMRFAFSQVLPRYTLLNFLGVLLRLWQLIAGRSFLKKFVSPPAPDTTPTSWQAMIQRLAAWEAFTPAVPPHIPLPKLVHPRQKVLADQSLSVSDKAKDGADKNIDVPHDGALPAELPSSHKPQKAALFAGCVMDVFYNHVNHASVKLMVRQGQSVEVPQQTCCGALAYHAGEVDIATKLAKENISLFGFSETPIVVTSAGCGAMLKHYGHLLSDNKEFASRAEAFSNRVVDLSEFLAHHEFTRQPKPLPETTTYHQACHLAHAQNVRKEPQLLLSTVAGQPESAPLVPLPESEHCCGSAGIYNLFNTELSLAVLDRKLDFIEQTGAKIVVTSNPGCMLQLEAGIKERNLPVKVMHLAELLDQIYES